MLTQPSGYFLPDSPTCIVACSSAVARCWLSESRHSDWEELARFTHEEATRREQDFQSDRPGRSFDSLGRGRHAMSLEHSAKEQSNMRFAETVADFLNQSVNADRFRHVAIFADPKFLGLLRDRLSPATAAAVAFDAAKNLVNLDVREIRRYFD